MQRRKRIRGPSEELPQDLWDLILKRLPSADRVRSSLVCKQWSSALQQIPAPAPVWIVDCNLPGSYFDLGGGATQRLSLPESVPEGGLLVPSKSWLTVHPKGTKKYTFKFDPVSRSLNLEVDDTVAPINTQKFYMLDPISRAEIPLPPLPAHVTQFGSFNIEVSSKDASQAVIAGLFDAGDTLAVCKPKDESWTRVEDLSSWMNYMPEFYEYDFHCILFSHGILYLLVRSTRLVPDIPPQYTYPLFQIQTRYLKLSGDHDLTLKIIQIDDLLIDESNTRPQTFLVESEGELLLLLKILKFEDNKSPPAMEFQVFKVEPNGLTRLSSLDDQTLFVDPHDAVSYSSENLNKNCIYFSEAFRDYEEEEEEKWKHQSGIFYLEDRRIEPISFLGGDRTKRGYGYWFFPNIKTGGFN